MIALRLAFVILNFNNMKSTAALILNQSTGEVHFG